MIERGLVALDEGPVLQVGPTAEKAYGGGHYRDLMATFTGAELLTARHGATEVGYLDPAVLSGQGEDCVVLLSGRSWSVREIDWRRRMVWLEPTSGGGKARWMGGGRECSAELAAAIRDVLRDGEVGPIDLSRRARSSLDELRDSTPAGVAESVEGIGLGRFRLWTFAGTRANRRRMLGDRRHGAYRFDGLFVDYRVDPRVVPGAHGASDITIEPDDLLKLASAFKFADMLPTDLVVEMVHQRLT